MAKLQPQPAKEIWRLDFHGAWPTATTFLKDALWIAAGDRNGRIMLWRLPADVPEETDDKPADFAPRRVLIGHENSITHLRYLAASDELLSASLDGTIRRWKLSASADGKTSAVVARKSSKKNDPPPEPIELESQTQHTLLAKDKGWINGFDVSADGRRAISGDDRGEVCVWNVESNELVTNWQGHPQNWIAAVALSADGSKAFVSEYGARRGSFDRPPPQLRLYETATGKELVDYLKVKFPDVKDRGNGYSYGTLTGKFLGRGLVSVAFSPDGQLIAGGMGGETGDAKVHLFNTETGENIRTISKHQNGITAVAFSSDGKYLLSAGRDTTIRICQVSDGKEVTALGESRGGQFKDWIAGIAISADQGTIVSADIAGFVRVWRLGA